MSKNSPAGHFYLPIDQFLIKDWIVDQDWNRLDQYLNRHFVSNNWILEKAKELTGIQAECIEYILSRRTPPDDEGIWHDDGSRKLAFTVSLTLNPAKVVGGQFSLRNKKNLQCFVYDCLPFGQGLFFPTGQGGYEHKVHAVESGDRLVFAGWLT
jgi:hypothetical protein